jgi:D-alanyl-D-alanine carboxypeptidase (penicillin-binding protein 5/6)
VLAAALCVASVTGGPALAATPTPAVPCTVALAPPPAIDSSERPMPGQPAPAPLPVPAQPVGGPRMGECGTVLPPGAPGPPPVEDSVSWIIADLDTGAVLAARDPHARQRPASLLKILTSLVVLNRLDLDTVVAGTEADADAPGSRVGVGPGGRYTVRQLLTGLIMNSGNDAANALARTLGGVPATLRDMSAQAARLGASDTRPASPSGLDAPGMCTSAYDLALFYRAVIRDATFAQISDTRLYDWPGRGDLPGFKISNDNHMLTEYPGTFGGKTGFTDDARHTRITAARRHGRRLVVVQMRGEQHPVSMDTQAARLLDYGFALPADTPSVGQLVDGPVATSTPEAPPVLAASAGSADTPAQPSEESRQDRNRALATIGGGAILGALLSVLITRRRDRPRGRHCAAAAPR